MIDLDAWVGLPQVGSKQPFQSRSKPAAGLLQFLLGSELAALARVNEAEAAFANAVLPTPDFPMARYQLGLLRFCSDPYGHGIAHIAAVLAPSVPKMILANRGAFFPHAPRPLGIAAGRQG